MSRLLLLACLVVGLVGGLMGAYVLMPAGGAVEARETAYERVMRTGTLRCGYGSWDPAVVKDPQTGIMRGFFVETLNEMGRIAGFKVDWVGEVDWGQIPQALENGKIDAFCAAMAGDAARAKFLAYTRPTSYWSFDILVRADDPRFPTNRPLTLADINKPEFGMAYTEGDVLETIVKTELPLVKRVSLPLLGSPADNILSLLNKKTDVIVFPRVMMQTYEKQNGTGKLRLIELPTPLRVYGNVIGISNREPQLLNYLNAAADEFINSSAYDRVMAPYNTAYPGAFLKPAKPYVGNAE